MGLQLATDANTVALYHMSELHTADALVDASGNGYGVAVVGAPYSLGGPLVDTNGVLQRCRFNSVNGSPGGYFVQAAQQAGMQAVFVPGVSVTIECLIWPRESLNGIDATYGTIMSYAGNDGTSATNNLIYMYMTSAGQLFAGWQHGTHVSTEINSASGAISFRAWHHVCFVREYTGSQYNGYLYLDGNQVATSSAMTAPAGGGSSKLSVGSWTGFALPFGGDITEARISNKARSAAEVAATYTQLFSSLIPPVPPPGPLPVVIPNPIANGVGAVDFGADFDFLNDLNPKLPLINGLANLGQALAHRLETPRGGLFYDLDYGTDVRGLLNAAMTPQALAKLKGDVQSECLKDERVQSCACTATFVQATGTLTLSLNVSTEAGPFQFVLDVSQVSVSLLSPTTVS